MWFRVELHKDGSVASCETVEGKLKDGKHVFYVEADTKAAALSKVVRQYQRSLEIGRASGRARSERLRAENKCWRCGKPREPGKSMCRKHLDDANRLRKRGPLRKRPETLEERALAHDAAVKRSHSKTRDRYGMSPIYLSVCRRVLVEVLAAYDDDPAGFREWMQKKLDELGVEDGSYEPILERTFSGAAAE